MVTAQLKGGLGNQMFQIAAATSLAIDNNDECCINFDEHKIELQGFNALKYKNNIFSNIKNCKINVEKVYKEPYFNFNKIPYYNNLKIDGFFQSEKYFINNKDLIIKLFSQNNDLNDKLNEIINTYKNNKVTVSLHVRRGDYLMFPNIHPVISLDYINSALKLFNNCSILVFSDDIKWCVENIKNDDNDIYFINNTEKDYYELYLMSLCDNNIISNSTFAWWGAYLNKNEDKKVIAPKNWFGSEFKNDFTDIYTKNMIKI